MSASLVVIVVPVVLLRVLHPDPGRRAALQEGRAEPGHGHLRAQVTVRQRDGATEATGFRIKKGGGAFIFPLLERVDVLSLEVMTLDITTPEVYTKPGVPIVVDGVAQVKISGDEASIRTAAEQFLGKTVERDQGDRAADGRGAPAGDHRHADGRGDLPQPRPVRRVGAGGRGLGPGEHGAADRLLHAEGHPRQPRLPRGARQAAHRRGQARRDHRAGRGRPRRDHQVGPGAAGRRDRQVRGRDPDRRGAARLPDEEGRLRRRR